MTHIIICMILLVQVVSACHDSVVCVWSLETGEKIIQFSNAHGYSEITAMIFDPSKRRLITGARDGTVRIWNFNNGCCLSELQAVDNAEVLDWFASDSLFYRVPFVPQKITS